MEVYLRSLQANEPSTTSLQGFEDGLMTYLKTLSSPALDAELRSICLHEADEEGLDLLLSLLTWLADTLSTRSNFELVTAYLYRLLLIYESILSKDGRFKDVLQTIRKAQEENSERIRGLVHSNLCLLKVFAKVN